MEQLHSINPSKETASNAQIMFLVINTSSVTLIPVSIMLYRSQAGSSDPAMVFVPILLATCCSTLAGIMLTAWIQNIKLAQRPLIGFACIIAAAITLLVITLQTLTPEMRQMASSAIGNISMVSIIGFFLLEGWRKSVPVYENFIEGAKEGFNTAVRIIPYLVAMLVAVSTMKASGIFGITLEILKKIFEFIGIDTEFAPALPTALIKPFSGSGARAMMIDTMHSYGADSFPALVAAVIQGSTETTFYVLSVYFGAVGIKRIRHAAGCGLLADLAGVIASILVCYYVFK
jgi:spore maturation protein SpmB